MWPEGSKRCRCGCQDDKSDSGDESNLDSDGEGAEDPVQQAHGQSLVLQIQRLIARSRAVAQISGGKKGPGDASAAR